jgi:enhancing lycopene biosynthesis protein 2
MRDTFFDVMGNKVAVFLAGCGHADGAEITESVLTNLALRSNGLETEFFSLDAPQMHVLNHASRQVSEDTRNILDESARIARGQVKPAQECDLSRFDAVAFPGGYGVAKNFCDFAVKGKNATVNPAIEKIILETLLSQKPLLAVCIAPALVGLVAHKAGLSLTLTLGADNNDAAQAMKLLGHKVESKLANQFSADEKHFVVSTPAYMHDTQPEVLWKGISLATTHLLTWLKQR